MAYLKCSWMAETCLLVCVCGGMNDSSMCLWIINLCVIEWNFCVPYNACLYAFEWLFCMASNKYIMPLNDCSVSVNGISVCLSILFSACVWMIVCIEWLFHMSLNDCSLWLLTNIECLSGAPAPNRQENLCAGCCPPSWHVNWAAVWSDPHRLLVSAQVQEHQ